MNERRAAPRARSCISGSALTAFAVKAEPCLIQNLSRGGAYLVFREGFAIPKHFALFVGQDRQAQQVMTMWRNGNVTGVKFLQPRATAPEVLPG